MKFLSFTSKVALYFQGWGTRYTYSVMCFLSWALNYSVRVDMSVAIVAMVNTSECYQQWKNLMFVTYSMI